jgi:hypothetical protein
VVSYFGHSFCLASYFSGCRTQHSHGPGEIDNRWNDLCANALCLYQSATGTNAVFVNRGVCSGTLSHQRDFLAELNRGKNLDRLTPGDAVQVPNVAPLEIESLKPADDIPPKLDLNSHVINVDTKKKILEIREGDNLLAAFPITPGSKQLPAPVGTWKVTKMTTLPWFAGTKPCYSMAEEAGITIEFRLGLETKLEWSGSVLIKKALAFMEQIRPKRSDVPPATAVFG